MNEIYPNRNSCAWVRRLSIKRQRKRWRVIWNLNGAEPCAIFPPNDCRLNDWKSDMTAGTALRGKSQPWRFVVVQDSEITRKSASRRTWRYEAITGMSEMAAQSAFWERTNITFFENRAFLVVVFRIIQLWKRRNRTPFRRICRLAVGCLTACTTRTCTVTHTGPMNNFCRKSCSAETRFRSCDSGGYPAENAKVPNIKRKELNEIMQIIWNWKLGKKLSTDKHRYTRIRKYQSNDYILPLKLKIRVHLCLSVDNFS